MHSIARNISAATWARTRGKLWLINTREERNRAEQYRQSLSIRTPNVAQLVSNLSGGNKQKVSLAKWLIADPEILIIDEPTVGIDIKTKYEIHDLVVQLAEQGMAIILVSSDLPEMIRLADRILVFREGQVLGSHTNTKDYEHMSEIVMSSIMSQRK